ncbi:hypothetical protein AMAG_02620 [Allomyces macrogynus ATCC 38327]|uniref:Uncharacterized protein n=1 Tax=Allomyces macrogynus (strain ATCC 38327) TaxID=578462 RepID=A0A0L0S2P1_ALLM3|nr:hypothetical protein AMAG_02620 [Allomyces macrogynus ATCC 38327]|eukprot:KNE56847.1 hypothetical protein AMAG_02620 [Allomyces macrogynus ATCC 38327]
MSAALLPHTSADSVLDDPVPVAQLHKIDAGRYAALRRAIRAWPLILAAFTVLATTAWALAPRRTLQRPDLADLAPAAAVFGADSPVPSRSPGAPASSTTARLLMHPPPASSAFRFFEREPGNLRRITNGNAPREPPLERKAGLLAMHVSASSPTKSVLSILTEFDRAGFDITLFHADDNYLELWSKVPGYERWATVYAAGQSKWWFAKRFLTPMVVDNYDFVLVWDDDAILPEGWTPDQYVALLKAFDLHAAHPVVVPLPAEVDADDAAGQTSAGNSDDVPDTDEGRTSLHRRGTDVAQIAEPAPTNATTNGTTSDSSEFDQVIGQFTTRIATDFPIFSRAAWPCTWRLISYDGTTNEGTWYPTCAAHGLCRFAIVDSFPVGRRGPEPAPVESDVDASSDTRMQALCSAAATSADMPHAPMQYEVVDTIDIPRLPPPHVADAARKAKEDRDRKLEDLARKLHVTVPELLYELERENDPAVAIPPGSVAPPLDVAPWHTSDRVRAMCAYWLARPTTAPLRAFTKDDVEGRHTCPEPHWPSENLPWWADQLMSPADARAAGPPPQRTGFMLARDREMARTRALRQLIDDERRRVREKQEMAAWYGAPYELGNWGSR